MGIDAKKTTGTAKEHGHKKKLSSGFANNKGADQPALLHRLISAFIIRFVEKIINKLATSEISII